MFTQLWWKRHSTNGTTHPILCMPRAVEWRIEGGGQEEHYPGAHRSTSISSLAKKGWVTSAWKWLGWWELNLRIFTGSHGPKWMFRLMMPGSGGLQDSLGSCWYVICEWYQWQNIIKATSPRLQTSDHWGSCATHFMGGHKNSVHPSYWKLWWRTRRTWCPVASFLSAVCCWKSLASLLQANLLWNWASQGAPDSCVPRVKLAHQTAGCNRSLHSPRAQEAEWRDLALLTSEWLIWECKCLLGGRGVPGQCQRPEKTKRRMWVCASEV